MNLSADTIIEISLELTQQLIEAHSNNQCFDGIKNIEDKWTIITKEETPADDEPVKLLRSILQHHNPLIPSGLSHGVLQNHLSLMAPDLPVDFLPVLLAFFADGQSQSTLETLKAALERALSEHTKRAEPDASADIEYDIGYDTHIGVHKALYMQTNQDSFYIAQEDEYLLLCVLDGISTSDAGSGDMASAIARNVIHQIWEQHKDSLDESNEEDLAGLLYHMLREANFHICKFAKEIAGGTLGDKTPMGTTAVVALLKGADGIVATLGDSRAYLHTAEGTAILTGDHNLRGEKLRQGMPLFHEDEGYALIRYLGHFDINREEAEFVNPDFRRFKICTGESLLICSDGLTDYAAQNHFEFHGLLQEAQQFEKSNQACWYLTNKANEGGGGDNITIIFVKRTA